jgi:hypothetical protein
MLLLATLFLAPRRLLAQTGPDNTYCARDGTPNFGSKDGPAELPQSCFYTALNATPSPGKSILVSAGEGLAKVIANARCGDTILLPPGAQFTGAFHFPDKGCDDLHWITIRSDGQLPPEGTRITPCYAGVRSLPGRPAYKCAAGQAQMAKLIVPAQSSITVTNHYRFMGLEITRVAGGGILYNLVQAQGANKIIFDRDWIHGDTLEETVRGVSFPGARDLAVIDSYFSDFHCTARTGSCVDSQALWAGIGDDAGGTYKIVNNFLEAAAEGILFGGGPGTATPVDIEIRRNHFFKPLIWNPSDAGFLGTKFMAKNNLELKNAARVLIEANILEDSWGGFTQEGFQILLTPKNQNGRCPECTVHDVTIRMSVLRHSGAGFQIANAAADNHALSQGLMNVSIHDIVIEDVDETRFDGNGVILQISSDGPHPVHDLTLDHLTAGPGAHVLLELGSPGNDRLRNMAITNSVFFVPRYQVVSTGGQQNCAFRRFNPQSFFDSCWNPYSVTNNILIGASDRWPDGNFIVRDLKDAGLTSSLAGSTPDWKIAPNSRYHGKAEDGRDPGADISQVYAAIAGVE